MSTIGNEINELLDELTKEHGLQELLPGDVTIKMLMERTGLSQVQCTHILRQEAEKGNLIVFRTMGDNGKPVNAYRKNVV